MIKTIKRTTLNSLFRDIHIAILAPLTLIIALLLYIFYGETPFDIVCLSIGVVGIFFSICFLFLCLFRPIARDRMLVKGHFTFDVILFVFFIPFIYTVIFKCFNIVTNSDLLSSSEGEYKNATLFWDIYYHFVNPGSQHMATAHGRLFSGLIAISGIILLNGVLISTLTSWFERRKEQWTNGDIRYKKRSFRAFRNSKEYVGNKIAVVIGAGENAPTIIKNLLDGKGETKKGRPYYVVLLTNGKVKEVRDRIASYLNEEDSERLVIYNGQLDSVEEVNHIPIELATEIYVLGEENGIGDDSASYHDTQNMKCVHNIASYLTQNQIQRRIICRVQFEYQTTYSVFQFSDLPDNIKEHLVFIPFNRYENWAQAVFVDSEYSEKSKADNEQRIIKYTPLDGSGISVDSDKNVHLIVVGMTKMGIAVAIQAAQIAHYPNFKIDGDNPHRTKITFIDPDAENEMNFFMGRYQNLFNLARHRYLDLSGREYAFNTEWIDPLINERSEYTYLGPNFLDIEWEFIKGSVEQPGVQEYLRQSAEEAYSCAELENSYCDGKSLLTIAICNNLSSEAIAEGIYMPANIYDKAQQILVYQPESSEILYNLYFAERDNISKRYSKLRPFGMQNADFTINKASYYCAMLCNYVYFSKPFGTISNDTSNKLDDIVNDIRKEIVTCTSARGTKEFMRPARDAWKTLSIFNKWSNKYLSNSFKTKLRSIGYTCDKYLCGKNLIEQKMESCKKSMAECEHNRWNTQQLLMGLRAYTENENNEYITILNNEGAGTAKGFKKSKQNGREKAHLDIRSYSRLEEDDPQNHLYDEVFNACIPEILAVVESFSNDLV